MKILKKGHNYVTVVSHPKSGVIIDIGENRDEKSVNYLRSNVFTEMIAEPFLLLINPYSFFYCLVMNFEYIQQ